MKDALGRGLAALITLLLAASALLAFRTAQRGERELGASERAFDAGQVELALQHARRAAAAYVPGAGHVERAYERLRAIARGAERARDPELARLAWHAVRGAAWESRHVWQPHAAELREADAELTRLEGTAAPGAPSGPSGRAPRPSLGFVLALAGGAASTVLGVWALLGQERGSRAGASGVRLAAAGCLVGALAWGWALLAL